MRTGVGDCQAALDARLPATCRGVVVELARVKYVSPSSQSHVHSMQLSYRVASAGRGTVRDDAVDFRKILGREHNVGGAHILIDVLARFRARYWDDKNPGACSLNHWPRDGELGERGVLAARNGLERSTQLEVLLDIGALKA